MTNLTREAALRWSKKVDLITGLHIAIKPLLSGSGTGMVLAGATHLAGLSNTLAGLAPVVAGGVVGFFHAKREFGPPIEEMLFRSKELIENKSLSSLFGEGELIQMARDGVGRTYQTCLTAAAGGAGIVTIAAQRAISSLL